MTVLAGVLVVVGLVGILLPVLPGLLLTWAGVALWCINAHSAAGWTLLAVVSVLAVLGTVVKYLIPGRRLREAGVPWITLAAGAGLGVVGFFVVPVVGLPLGFVLGIYLAELARLRNHEVALRSTRHALAAVGWSTLIELVTGLLIASVWLVTLIAV